MPMNKRNRKSLLAAYIAMVTIVLVIWFVLTHLLLGLPIWFVTVLSLFPIAAVTLGTWLAIRRKP